MPATFEQRMQQFHRKTIEQMRNVGLSAYILNEDGSVLHIKPDGKRELIVTGTYFTATLKSDAIALTTG
ncbi:MAG TPA: hypothetical protein VGN82_03825 [Bosea sp. (in: a-proteobacteria)]|jgi:hypothetical protein|uniref:hypothetical protein n=1 Tax=Bosea sp. (in: a-proteobacteria) TaxID=1871050 RepID=UPI002E11E5A6|nr:hypothetical protein [Bosea sp. (in: a-proteobacteria)]